MNRDELIATIPVLPEGWEFTGEFRLVRAGEWYWNPWGKSPVYSAIDHSETSTRCWILQRIKPDHDKLRREGLDALLLPHLREYYLTHSRRELFAEVEAIFKEHPMKGKE